MRVAFKLQTGRVIGLCRVTVAVALLATAPHGHAAFADERVPALLVMGGYLALTIALLVIARVDWWLGHHLARLALAIDFLLAFVLLYMAEVAVTGVISPFMALFVFLLLSATLQWKARGALVITIFSIVGYLLVGVALQATGDVHENTWFARRFIFMVAIGAFVIWFGLQREHGKVVRLDWPIDAGMEEQFAAIARFLDDHYPAAGVALAWSPQEEPWTIVFRSGSLGDDLHKQGPQNGLAVGATGIDATLFGRDRMRALQLTQEGRTKAFRGHLSIALAEQLGVMTGIAAPIRSQIGNGMLLLTGIPAVSADHLVPAKLLADELAYALDRHEMIRLMQRQEAIRLRADFARDLHDSVAQSLAGSEFRIAALQQGYAAGRDITADLAATREALALEAVHVGTMISDLRQQEPQVWVANPVHYLRRALREAADRWGIGCQATSSGDPGTLSNWMVRQVQLIIREAVANAVRHAAASHVNMDVIGAPRLLKLHITNDGAGFPEDWLGEMPQSIADRVESLGGTMGITREAGLTRLSLHLPTERL